jgi:hypothetical protein
MIDYNRDLMTYDELTGQFILTEAATIREGLTLRARLSRKKDADPTTIINYVLRLASNQIYNYLHKFSIDNARQNGIIAHNSDAQTVVYRAMVEQLNSILMNGDLSRSVDKAKRALMIDENAKEQLNLVVPTLGIPLTYQGVW